MTIKKIKFKVGMIILAFTLLLSLYAQAADKKPKWVDVPSKGCSAKKEICAVGFGEGRMEAERLAKVELSKYLSNNVSGKFTSNLASQSGQTTEELSEQIKEETDNVLEGASIKEVFEAKTGFYALAMMDKSKAAQGLKLKIDNLDTEIKVLHEDESTTAKAKLKKMFGKRQGLNQTYRLLSGVEIPSPINASDILKASQAALKTIIAHVYLDEDEPKSIEAQIISLLSAQGYKVTSGRVRNPKATHIVTGEVISEKQYMNVAGFEKYKFIVKVSAQTAEKVISGHFNLEGTASGRNLQQSYEKVLTELTPKLSAKVEDLNIE